MDPFLLATIAVVPIGLLSFELVRASKSSRRNREERCAKCGGPLYAPRVAAGPSLIEGHLVCEPCASKGRRALTRSLIAAASITGSTVLALAAVAVWAPSELGGHPWLPAVATALTYPPIFAGAVARMKRANRRAAQRLSALSDFAPRPMPVGAAAFDDVRTPNEC